MIQPPLESDVRRLAAIEDRHRRSREYTDDIGFLVGKIGRLSRDHAKLHGLSDSVRTFLEALEFAEGAEKARMRKAGIEIKPEQPIAFPLDAVRDDLAALAAALNDLDRTVNRGD